MTEFFLTPEFRFFHNLFNTILFMWIMWMMVKIGRELYLKRCLINAYEDIDGYKQYKEDEFFVKKAFELHGIDIKNDIAYQKTLKFIKEGKVYAGGDSLLVKMHAYDYIELFIKEQSRKLV